MKHTLVRMSSNKKHKTHYLDPPYTFVTISYLTVASAIDLYFIYMPRLKLHDCVLHSQKTYTCQNHVEQTYTSVGSYQWNIKKAQKHCYFLQMDVAWKSYHTIDNGCGILCNKWQQIQFPSVTIHHKLLQTGYDFKFNFSFQCVFVRDIYRKLGQMLWFRSLFWFKYQFSWYTVKLLICYPRNSNRYTATCTPVLAELNCKPNPQFPNCWQLSSVISYTHFVDMFIVIN